MSENIYKDAEKVERLLNELMELRNDIKKLKREIKSDKNNENIKENDYDLYKSLIHSLIKSNIELQSKISELIVMTNNLMKDLRTLLDILKEAAMERLVSGKESKSREKENNMESVLKVIESKFDEIGKVNLKIIDVLNQLNKSLAELKEKSNQSQNQTKQTSLPPKYGNLPPLPLKK